MVDVDGPTVVVLKRSTNRYIVVPVKVEICYGCDGRTKPGTAWFIFIGAAV